MADREAMDLLAGFVRALDEEVSRAGVQKKQIASLLSLSASSVTGMFTSGRGGNKTPPSWERVEAIVRFCWARRDHGEFPGMTQAAAARALTDAEERHLQDWRLRHAMLVRDLEQAREGRAGLPVTAMPPPASKVRFSLSSDPPAFTGQGEELDQITAALTGAAGAGRFAGVLRVPGRPEPFCERPEIRDQVMECLMRPGGGRAGLVAMVGMSGSGKTSLAMAVGGEQEDSGDLFPDGVLWVDVRETPAEVCQSVVAEAIGADIPGRTVAAGKTALRHCLAGARCLLILDDVTQTGQIEALDVLDRDSVMLVTTRNEATLPPDTQRCRVFPFKLADPAEHAAAMALLARYATGTTELPAEALVHAEEIVVRCGGLPLVLAISGTMVRDQYEWAGVAALLGEADPKALEMAFHDYPHSNLLAAIAVGAACLDERTLPLYEELAVFSGRGPVPVAAAARLWSVDVVAAQRIVNFLARRSLLFYQPDRSTFVLHDLQYQYVRWLARDRIAVLHGRLAEAFLALWGSLEEGLAALDQLDPAADDIRYGIINVPYHLAQAGRDDLLHELLAAELASSSKAGNAWFAVHDEMGLEAEYLADLELARGCAEQGAESAAPEAKARNLALEVRYSLIRSLMADMAQTVPGGALAALVTTDAWPFGRARAYAEMIPDPFKRVDALITLARRSRCSRAELMCVIEHIKAAVPDLRQPIDRIYAVACCAEFSPDEPGRRKLFDRALHMVDKAYQDRVGVIPHDGMYREVRAKLLAHMAASPGMARDLRERAAGELLDGARLSRRFDHSYQEELTAAMPHLGGLPNSQELRDTVIDIARRACSRRGDHGRAEALAIRLRYASGEEKDQIIDEMLVLHYRLGLPNDDGGAGWEQRNREYLVCQLAGHLDGDGLGGLIASTLTRASAGGTIRVLAAALPYLPDIKQEEACAAAAAAIRSKGAEVSRKARAEMAALMKALSGPLRAELIQETFDRLHDENPSQAALLLCELAQADIPLPEPLLQRTASSRLSSGALDRLASLLPRDLLGSAVTSHRHLPDDPKGWARALTGLVPVSPGTCLPGILDLFRSVAGSEEQVRTRGADDKEKRIRLLTGLAERLPPDVVSTAAEAVPADATNGIPAAELMAALAARAPADQRRSLFQQAHNAACSTRLCDTPFRTLIRDAKDADQLLGALRLVSALVSPARTPQIVSRHPRGEELARRALDIAREISSPCSRTGYLATLVSHFPDAQRPAVLREAAQAALLPHLRNDGPCGLHGLDEAARLVPWPDRLPLTHEATDVLAPGDGSNERMRQLLCLVAYHPGADGGEFRDRAVQCLAALNPPGDEPVSLDLYSALRVLAPCLSPDGTLASAETALARYLPAETIPRIAQALSEFLPELGHAAPGLHPGHVREPADLRSQVAAWRARMQDAAREGQSAFLSFIASNRLPFPQDSPDASRKLTGQSIAQEMLSVRRSWLRT